MAATLLGAALIFGLRLIDVSISTIRLVVMMRGHLRLATFLSFFESLLWITATSLVFANLGDPVRAVAFAAGFAGGVFLGNIIERRIAMGNAFVRVVAPVEAEPVAPHLRAAGFPMTVVNAEGKDGEVRLNFSVIPRRRVKEMLALVHEVNPGAFVTVEEVALPDLERLRGRNRVRT
jgi:uncharacterized protein YebE (UPF0316 family)